GRQAAAAVEPFYPFGPYAAAVRPRGDGALVFEVFGRDFPFRTTPLFAFEDLHTDGVSFGEPGRVWFGGAGGVKAYAPSDLDADAQAAVVHAVEALRRDAVAFFAHRSGATTAPKTRQEFAVSERAERSLGRTVAARRDLAATLSDVADRLAPRPPETGVAPGELFTPLPPPSLAPAAHAPPATLAHAPPVTRAP